MDIPERTGNGSQPLWKRTRRTVNHHHPFGPWALVELTNRSGYFAAYTLVDREDLENILAFARWYAVYNRKARTRYVYAYIRGSCASGRRQISLHRWLLNAPTGKVVDHIHRDHPFNTLDNRRSYNLRAVPHGGNLENRRVHPGSKTGYRNVIEQNGAYWVHIHRNGRRHSDGPFATTAAANERAVAMRIELFPYSYEAIEPENIRAAWPADIAWHLMQLRLCLPRWENPIFEQAINGFVKTAGKPFL